MAEGFSSQYQIVFLFTAGLLVLLERVGALQRDTVEIGGRWTANIGLLVIGSIAAAVVVPIGLYEFARAQPPGPLAHAGMPMSLQIVLTLLLVDIYRYGEHRLFHCVPLFWRLHLVHHSDTQLDVTTAERHHPLESLLSTATMMALLRALGLPAAGIGLYLLLATAVMFCSHANLRIPRTLDRLLRGIVVTPPVHAVHHSALQAHTNSNYGDVLTLWDRLFGTYADPDEAAVAHFGLGYFHQPGDTTLGRVLQQPFLFRSGMSYPARANAGPGLGLSGTGLRDASGAPWSANWKRVLRWGLAGGVLAGVALWPTFVQLVRLWSGSEPYQYAWLVIPTVVYLVGWHHRQQTLALEPQPSFAGVLVAAGAAALWSIAALTNIDAGQHLALVLAVQGIAMAMLGWRAYWKLLPILSLLFLMIPSGDVLQPFLRAATVRLIELFAVATQLPHHIEGFVIFIGAHRYVVASACSGLTYVTLAVFLSYSFGLLLYGSLLRALALAVFGALLGILCNAVRVNAIVLIDWLQDSQMPLTAHGTIQWVALLLSLGVLFFVVSRLSAEAGDASATTAAAPAPQATYAVRRFAPAVAGLVVLGLVRLMALPANDVRRPHAADGIPVVPQDLAGWTLVSPTATWTVDLQNQSESVDATYRRDGQDMQVRLVQTLAPNAKVLESQMAPGGNETWREARVEKQTACSASRCLTLNHTTWQDGKSGRQRHLFYAYGIGSYATDSKLLLRAAHGWQRAIAGGSYPWLIGFVVDGAAPPIGDLAMAFESLRLGLDVGSPQ